MGDFEEALANFNDTLLYLRGNNSIDYEQLGLKFKLYSCEALFNRGLCYIYLQQKEPGMQDLMYAAREKVVPDHDVIDEAIREEAEVNRTRDFQEASADISRDTLSFRSPLESCTVQTKPKSRTSRPKTISGKLASSLQQTETTRLRDSQGPS